MQVEWTTQNLRPHNLLLWETLKWARQEGRRWYEIGPYFPYLPEDTKMAQVGNFKRQFGGKEFSLFEGVFFHNWPKYLRGILFEEACKRVYGLFRRFISIKQK
jgi:hypothetical protein